jgi:DNA-binding NarL/FixJ family response regulator
MIVVMDISLPTLNGLEATSRILKKHPGTKVILLTMHFGEEYVYRAIEVGAYGYLTKTADIAEMLFAIKTVWGGSPYFSPGVTKHLLKSRNSQQRGTDFAARLSSRHKEILQLIAEGRSTKDIAVALDIAVKTVHAHKSEIMKRLSINNLAGLVRYALRHGLVQIES